MSKLNHDCRRCLKVLSRRELIGLSLVVAWGIHNLNVFGADEVSTSAGSTRFFFTSQGKTALATIDGSEPKYLSFDKPGQATWQPGSCFPDGRRVVVLSMEPRRDGPGRPFEEFYTQTPTHLWQYDLESGSLDEICTKDRIAPFTTPALLISDDRLLIQVVKNKIGQIYSVRLDGSDAHEFTKAGEGLPYGLSLSPDGKRVAFHLASPQGYQVWTSDIDGSNRIRVAAQPGHLYFGTQWSPDGQWVLYVDCLHQQDPGHDWADVCIGRPDGSEHRVLTTNRCGLQPPMAIKKLEEVVPMSPHGRLMEKSCFREGPKTPGFRGDIESISPISITSIVISSLNRLEAEHRSVGLIRQRGR